MMVFDWFWFWIWWADVFAEKSMRPLRPDPPRLAGPS